MSEFAPAHAQGQWAARLVEFNLHPARFAHRSWHAPFFQDWSFEAHAQRRAEPRLSDWLRHEWIEQGEADWQMQEPEKRLWLLDVASLEHLTYLLGLALHRDWLVRIVEGQRLRLLHEKVVRETLRFVVAELPEGLFHHHSPTVSVESSAPEEFGQKLKEDGARTLMALLQPEWRAVRARAQLHFDRSLALDRVTPFDAARCTRALELICGHLIPRRLPKWAWLF